MLTEDNPMLANARLTDGLGPLPEPYTRQWINAPFSERLLFSEDQMRAYAAKQVAAERERWKAALRCDGVCPPCRDPNKCKRVTVGLPMLCVGG